jgi:hypothetical protein
MMNVSFVLTKNVTATFNKKKMVLIKGFQPSGKIQIDAKNVSSIICGAKWVAIFLISFLVKISNQTEKKSDDLLHKFIFFKYEIFHRIFYSFLYRYECVKFQ